jgi:hypothetical protein
MAPKKTSVISVDIYSGKVSGQFINFTTMDVNTASLSFQVKNQENKLALSNVTPKIFLNMEDGSQFVEDCEIVDATNGVVQYTLKSNEIKHSGRVDAEFYLVYTDSSIGSFNFTFYIKKSAIDTISVPAQEVAIIDMDTFKASLEARLDDTQATLTSVQQQVTDAQTQADTITNLINQNQVAKQSDVTSLTTQMAESTSKLTDLYISVKDKQFGAKGDGVTDDTIAIQAAITYVESLGGGTIKFPKGTYWVKSDSTKATGNTGDGSSTPAGSCLVIRGSNITLLGAGKDKTKIVCHSPSGLLNETSYALIDYSGTGSNKVWRGGGIGIMGGTSSNPQKNITIRGIELDGTAHYTGNYVYPANTTTGDGWDITHRGVWINPDTYLSNVMVEECNIHSFKGELIYAAGSNVTKLYLRNSVLDDSNAEACNFADGYIKNNIIGQMAIGFEPFPLSNMNMVIRENMLNGPFAKGGIVVSTFDNITGKSGSFSVESNEIYNAPTGILLTEVRNATVRNNMIVDSSIYGIRVTTSAPTQPKPFNNCVIENNRIIQKTVSLTNAIDFLLGTYGASKTRVINNIGILDDQALAGVTLSMPLSISSGTFDNTCEVYGNHGKGTTNRTVNSMSAKNTLVTGTFNFKLFEYNNPPVDQLYRIELTYRVVTACNVQFSVYYQDVNGNVVTQTIIPTTARAIGTFSEPSIIIHAKAGYVVQLLCTPSVANAVYVTGKMSEV